MNKTNDEWQDELTPEQYRILRMKGTEAPGSGEYLNVTDKGTYACVGCGVDLFSSDTKYHSGCGWPSFYDGKKTIGYRDDDSLGMHRVEIYCKNCDGHLGHVFEDGPTPTSKRFCVNSVAINLKKDEA